MQLSTIVSALLAIFIVTTVQADERADRIDAVFKSYTEAGSPGAAITVMQGDEIVYEKGYGLAQLEYEIPITTKTIL